MIQFGESIKQENVYQTFKFDDAGDAITIRTTTLKLLDSTYGKFVTICGVSFNSQAATEEEAIASIQPASFTANTAIQNLLKTGAMKVGNTYKVTMTARKDSKYTNKKGEQKRLMAHQFEVVECFNIPPALEAALETEALNLADEIVTDIKPLIQQMEAEKVQAQGGVAVPTSPTPTPQAQPAQAKVRL